MSKILFVISLDDSKEKKYPNNPIITTIIIELIIFPLLPLKFCFLFFLLHFLFLFEKFGISISERFSSILSEWERKGDLIIKGDELFLSRDALLRVDSLLHGFFLPEHQDSRYV